MNTSTTTQQTADVIDALAPEIRLVTAGGKSYEVKRLETRQIWPILRCGLPIIEGLTALLGMPEPPLGGQPSAAGKSLDPPDALAKLLGPEMAVFLRVMAENGERINEILAVGIDEKISTVGRFEPQEAYLLIRALIEVNRDFFTHRVAPILGLEEGSQTRLALAAAVQQAASTIGAGATPSSN